MEQKVMLVGYEYDREKVLTRTGRSADTNLTVAASAEDALLLLEKDNYESIIFVDHNSIKDGLALFSLCKARKQPCKRIMVTAFADHKDLGPALVNQVVHEVIPKTWIRF